MLSTHLKEYFNDKGSWVKNGRMIYYVKNDEKKIGVVLWISVTTDFKRKMENGQV